MKRILTKASAMFLMLSMILGMVLHDAPVIFAANCSHEIECLDDVIKIPKSADEYVKDNYYSMVLASEIDYDLDKTIEDSLCVLGNPFIITNSNMNSYTEKYYYPVIVNGNITFVVSVIGTTDGWSLSMSQEFVEDLKRVNYLKYKYNAFILDGDEIVPNTVSTTNQVNDIIKEMQPIDCYQTDFLSIQKNTKETYRPSYSFNVTTGSDVGKIFSLYNKKAQGNLPICWAASVATMVNYRKGSNVSAKNVCDKMGTGYKGATIDTKLKALHEYGLTAYKKQTSNMSWKTIIKNVDNKRPIAMSTFSSDSGHAVTLVGYRFRNGTKYIVLWNSGNEKMQTVTYPSSGKVTFSYNNNTWVWTQSLARYVD